MGEVERVSAYYRVIGPAPDCGPGDKDTALNYLGKINVALALNCWSPYETMRLKKLKKRWEARALGRDARFNAVGTKGGRLTAELEYTIKPSSKRADGTRRNKLGGGGADGRSTRYERERERNL